MGFTLVELSVTLAVAAILVTMAVPSFRGSVLNTRLTSETNRVVTDIQLARSEALKRNKTVILCRSANPNAATPSCNSSANNWNSGWLVFVSGDTNTSYDSATDTLIKVSQAAADNLTISTSGISSERLIFNGDATTDSAGLTARFALCDDRGASHGKQVDIPPVGRPRIATSVSSCANPA